MKWAISELSPDLVDVGCDVRLPASWVITVTGEHGVPGTIQIHTRWDPVRDRVVAHAVTITRFGPGIDLTSGTIRHLRIAAFVSNTTHQLAQIRIPDDTWIAAAAAIALLDGSRARAQSMHNAVVTLYRLGCVTGSGPLKMIADTLHVNRSTATRLIARARTVGAPAAVAVRPGHRVRHADPL